MIEETILHYKILEKLGEGGMGVVYKAEDLDLKRIVALKFLPANISSSSEETAVLKHEAQAAAMLNHQNICTVYAIEEEKDEKFISMEYMDGITLRKKVADGPLSVEEAISYAIQIGEALSEAHKNGMIHRDIKTENIMINAKNRIKVMDFGLAVLRERAHESDLKGTFGTLAYLSPEQTLNQPANFTSDIWSYGVVCYEMFTGRLPFFDKYEAAIIYSILNEEPAPPTLIRPDIPPELEAIILKCIRKEEENRYQSAEQIVHDLNKLKKDIEVRGLREDFKKERQKKEKKAAELKQATIVYMQIQNYTELTGLVGQENMVEMLGKYYEIINHAAQKFGGTVNKTNTSEAVLYFGLPEAIENSAHNAVRAGIEITERYISMRKQFGISEKYSLNIAVSSGTVIAGSISSGEKLEYTVIGDAVETALALLDSSSKGQILVSSLTYKTVKEFFSLKQLKTISLKGKRDPVVVYELLIAGKNLKGSHIPAERLIKSEMIGRTDELDKLEHLIINTLNGKGSIVNIIAEAGIGKSRLLNELKKKKTLKQAVLLEGKAESTGKSVSFYPVTGILKQWFQIRENDDESQAFAKIEKIIRSLFKEEAEEILPFIAALMGFQLKSNYDKRINEISPDALSKLIQKSMRELLLKGSENNPLVFIIEDLHWADQSSIELLQSLFRLAENNKILFICTLRPNYHETGDKMISAVKEKYTDFYSEIRLEPLNDNDCRLLLENLLKMKMLPDKLKDSISKNTEGNPFFIEEVIRSLIDDNIIEIKNGQFLLSGDVDDIVVPVSVKDVLLARIDKLDEPVKYALKVASVVGRYFSYELLKQVTDEYKNLESIISSLLKLELIRENKEKTEREYLFYHALAQEAVYDTLLTKNRQELHLKVAAAIENIFAQKISDYYEVLAHHYSLGDDKEKAEEFLIKAGERTLKNAASSEALNYFNEALNLYQQKYGESADPEKLIMFEQNIGMALYNKGKLVDAVTHFDKALRLLGDMDPAGRAALIFRALRDFIWLIKDLYLPRRKQKREITPKDQRRFMLRQMRAYALANFDPQRLFFDLLRTIRWRNDYKLSNPEFCSMYSLGSSLMTFGGVSKAIAKRLLDKAGAFAVPEDTRSYLIYQYAYYIYHYHIGNWGTNLDFNEALFRKGIELGEFYPACYYISFLCNIAGGRGDFEYARKLAASLLEMAEVYDSEYALLNYHNTIQYYHCNKHEQAEMMREANLCLDMEKKMGLAAWIVGGEALIARAYILAGDLVKAEEALRRGEERLAKLGKIAHMFTMNPFLARLQLEVSKLEEQVSKNSGIPDRAAIKKITKRARKSSQSVIGQFKALQELKPEGYRLTGTLYWLERKSSKALQYWKKSIEASETMPKRQELGRTYLEVGKRLLEKDSLTKLLDNMDGVQYLKKAKEIFKEMDLKYDLLELERIESSINPVNGY